MRATIVASLMALAIGVLPIPTASAGYPAKTNGAIVYSGLKVTDADGSNRRQLQGSGQNPTWSPDGRRIAYTRVGDDGSTVSLHIRDIVTGADKVILQRQGLTSITWSPDGSRLAFQATAGETAQIFIASDNGGNVRQLTSHDASSFSPSWSPTGSRIAFTRGSDVFMINPDTGAETQWTPNCDEFQGGSCISRDVSYPTYNYLFPDWHPSGDSIAVYVQEDTGSSFNYFIGRLSRPIAKGEKPETLIDNHGLYPVWSPDGRFIAASSGTNTSIYQSTGALVATVENATGPNWQPCPTGTCPSADGEPPEDCTSETNEVKRGGPHTVRVDLPAGRATVTFYDVGRAGTFTIEECEAPELEAGIFARYELESSFSFRRAVVCLPYDENAARRAGLRESEINMIHLGGDGRRVITVSRDPDANVICGETKTFSAFYLGAGAQPVSIESACPPDRVPSAGFDDVPASSAHFAAIECLAWWEITRGVDAAGTRYGPEEPVSRGQMATFMSRVIERSSGTLPEPSRDWFTDDDGTAHEDNINRVREAGMVAGTSDTDFSPNAKVTRAQMATFLGRAYTQRTATTWSSNVDYFTDDNRNAHEAAINAAASAGITGGTDGLTAYDPAAKVTRAQMATFITRVIATLVENGYTSPPE